MKSKDFRWVKPRQAEWGKCSRTVILSAEPLSISYWDTIIAVGLRSGDIINLDAITGSCTVVLSGHSGRVHSVTFSSDGKLLASGADDKIVKLWDIQTGGIIKDFFGHQQLVWSVSISTDSAIIASGSDDETIHLWDISTGECYCVIGQQYVVLQVIFSPTDPQQLVGRLEFSQVSRWDFNGYQIGSTVNASSITFSSDGKWFALCQNRLLIVQTFKSEVIVAKFHVTSGTPEHCCFSPNNQLIAAAVDETAYVWDVMNSDSHPIETFIGHTNDITALVFSSPSSLISASGDMSVKFWQICASSTKSVETNLSSMSSPSHNVISTTLQAKDGITIAGNSDGTVRIWDISTCLCKASFQTPATDFEHGDGLFINGRLLFAWNVEEEIHIYGASEGELILVPRGSGSGIESLKIGGDGSKIFCLGSHWIQAWSIVTGELLSEVRIEGSNEYGSLIMDGSRVWAYYTQSEYQGWDFGIPGSSPVQLPNTPPSKLHLNGTLLWNWAQFNVQEVATERVAFQLPQRFRNPIDVQWDDQYLVICFGPTEVLILDFAHVLAS